MAGSALSHGAEQVLLQIRTDREDRIEQQQQSPAAREIFDQQIGLAGVRGICCSGRAQNHPPAFSPFGWCDVTPKSRRADRVLARTD